MRLRILGAVVFLHVTVASAEPESSEAEDAYIESIAFEEVLPEETGEWSVRGTVVTTREAEAMDTTATYVLASAQLFVGIADRLGGELELPVVMRVTGGPREVGLGNVGLGLKYLLHRQHGVVPHVTAILELRAPTATGRGAEDGTEVGAACGVAIARPSVVAQAAFGMASRVGSETAYALVDNLSVAVALPAHLHVLGEVVSETELPAFDARVLAGPGLRFAFTRDSFIAASALFAVTAGASARATVQVQYGF